MSKLESLLEYQKVDIELRKILDEIENSEYNTKLEQAKRSFSNAKQSVAESQAAAERIVNFINSSLAYYEESEKKIVELSDNLSKLPQDDIEGRKQIVAQMEIIKDKLADLEHKISERRQKSELIIATYRDSNERGKKMRDAHSHYKAKLEAFKEQKAPLIAELKKKLESMKGNIDGALFENYVHLTGEKKYPAVVVATTADGGRSFSCGGCGLNLSQKIKDILLDKGICTCDNCRRIVYKRAK